VHPNAALVETFYRSFQAKEPLGMIACYAPDVWFTDEVFDLRGKRAGAMWHMLCEAGKTLEVSFRDVVADDRLGSAHWEAHYDFSLTGRHVHNVIEARFEFAGGKIARHRDSFPFWKWSRMALGTSGLLLGWTPLVRSKVRKTAAKNLDTFVRAHPEYA